MSYVQIHEFPFTRSVNHLQTVWLFDTWNMWFLLTTWANEIQNVKFSYIKTEIWTLSTTEIHPSSVLYAFVTSHFCRKLFFNNGNMIWYFSKEGSDVILIILPYLFIKGCLCNCHQFVLISYLPCILSFSHSIISLLIHTLYAVTKRTVLVRTCYT